MSQNIQEIIAYIAKVEVLSTANGTSVMSIEGDLQKLLMSLKARKQAF